MRKIYPWSAMVQDKDQLGPVLQMMIQRPLSIALAGVSVGMVAYSLFARIAGLWYLEGLNYVDMSTVTMVGILLLRGLWRLRADADAQAASIALIGSLSFVFCFEAIYKLSFYTFPWRMAPAELREFILQTGIAATALAGFAFGKFRFSIGSRVFAAAFVLGWAVWLAAGFPQLPAGTAYYAPLVPVHLSGPMTYVLNRLVKISLCLVYYFFYA